jgi:hypothetical protein
LMRAAREMCLVRCGTRESGTTTTFMNR